MNESEVTNESETKEPVLGESQEFQLFEQFLAAKEHAMARKTADMEALELQPTDLKE